MFALRPWQKRFLEEVYGTNEAGERAVRTAVLSLARDVLALAERDDLGGMSFGFNVGEGGDHWDGDRRELRSVVLHEISVVSAWPAYAGTVVQARSRAAAGDARRRRARFFLATV